jgi:hypothetical protein
VSHSSGDADSTVPGWDEFIDRLRTLPARMLAKLPEPPKATVVSSRT